MYPARPCPTVSCHLARPSVSVTDVPGPGRGQLPQRKTAGRGPLPRRNLTAGNHRTRLRVHTGQTLHPRPTNGYRLKDLSEHGDHSHTRFFAGKTPLRGAKYPSLGYRRFPRGFLGDSFVVRSGSLVDVKYPFSEGRVFGPKSARIKYRVIES